MVKVCDCFPELETVTKARERRTRAPHEAAA
jgi:hypothetical protein